MYHVRHILRGLLKQPVLTMLGAVMMAVGLAFNIATTSVLSSLLGRPYPFPAIDNLIIVHDRRPFDGVHQRRPIASGDYVDLLRQTQAFSALAAWRPFPLVVGAPGEPEAVQGVAVTANFFDALGARTSLGRSFAAGEDRAGSPAVVLFSRRLWQARFGADPAIVGRQVSVNGQVATVIGVVPDAEGYPAGVDAWVPLVLSAEDREERAIQNLTAIGRLNAKLSPSAASADLARIAGDLAARYPSTNRGRGFDLQLLRREQYEFTAPLFLLLQAAAALVLGLGIANVASLFAARTLDRRHEFAMRLALGGSRRHVFALAVVEAMAIAVLSGMLAAPLTIWLVGVIRAAVPAEIAKWIAGWQAIEVDGPTMVAAVLTTGAAGAVLGVAAGLRATSLAVAPLRHAAGSSIVRRTGWLQRLLVAGQMSIAVLLLVTAAVTVRGYRRLSVAFEELRPASLTTLEVALPPWRYPDGARILEFHDRLLAELRGLPQVDSVALISNPPASNVSSPTTRFTITGRPVPSPADAPSADLQIVNGDTARTLALDIIAGRPLSFRDGADAPRTAIISGALARRVWSGANPEKAVGASIRLGLDPGSAPITIVGVTSDIRLNWFDPEPRSVIYLPDGQAPARQATVLIRTVAGVHSLAGAVHARVRRLDPLQPLTPALPLSDQIVQSIAPVRMIGLLLFAASAVALVLAAGGIYAVMAQWVAARRMEFGLRVALGADATALRRMVLRETMLMAAAGFTVGVPLAVATTVVAGTSALGLLSADPATVAVVAGFALAVAVASAAGPATRAAAADPARLLRNE
jgi:predicted permease